MKKLYKGLMLSSLLMATQASTAHGANVALPEAEPVEYVRVCDAYGEGYFYIPGTETCMRIGGFVYGQAQGGKDVYARSRAGLNPKTWRTQVRTHLIAETASETDLGTLRSHIELRSEFEDGQDTDTAELRFGYIELGGLRIGVDESAANTFFNYYGDFINDDVVAAGGYRTNLIQYTYAFDNGISALISLEQGGNDETDDTGTINNGTIKDYMPHVVLGAKYKQGWGDITGAALYDSVNDKWIGKAKVSLNVTDRWNVWAMGAYKDMEDSYYSDLDDMSVKITDGSRGFRAVDSFYGTWGGHWAGWLGTSYKFTPKLTGNFQVSYEGAGNPYSVANVAYELTPGLTLTPEVNYRKWNDIHSDLKGQDAVGGVIRLQRDF